MSYTFPDQTVRPLPWTARDITALVCQPTHMSPDDWRAVTFVAVVLAESGGDPLARGSVVWSPLSPAHLSIDLGMFQLNSYWQHTAVDPFPSIMRITVAQCFDPFASWVQSWKLLNIARKGWGYNMSHWTVFDSGDYLKYVTPALNGMREYRAAMGLGVGVFG